MHEVTNHAMILCFYSTEIGIMFVMVLLLVSMLSVPLYDERPFKKWDLASALDYIYKSQMIVSWRNV